MTVVETTGRRRRLGIDIGGTFTDSVSIGPDGDIVHAKVESTPDDFSRGFLNGVRSAAPDLAAIELLCHGTTVGTNAVITRRGAATALVTTRGFRDVLLLRRTARAEHFDLWWRPPEPLLGRRDIFEVDERLNFRGVPLVEIDEEQARRLAREIAALGKRAVAISFLHSFVNPAHEIRMKEIILDEVPEMYVSCSHEVLPEILEFERTSTTAVNAYLGPVLEAYIMRLREKLAGEGFRGELFVSSSTGGVLTPERVQTLPAGTIQSGPAAGVISGSGLATRAGFRNALTFDMGGTSTDIGLIIDGEARRINETHVEWGTPVHLPSVDITSIGAGGGSIAWIDPAGGLRSGPQSAGALPGPACYGRGGEEPTTTDAQIVLGRLDPAMFLGGAMAVDAELARQALETRISAPLGLADAVEAAASATRIAINDIVQSLRAVTTYRGLDPRDFVLLAFGGAGGLFAGAVAREADIPIVLVPPYPGLMSALGQLSMDLRHELVTAVMSPLDALDPKRLRREFDQLRGQAEDRLRADGVPPEQASVRYMADVRYYGTTHALTIGLHVGDLADDLAGIVKQRFEEDHLREYGYLIPPTTAVVELVNLRAVAIGSIQELPEVGGDLSPSTEAVSRQREVYWDRWRTTPIYDRASLRTGDVLDGPAIIEQADSTTVVEPGMTVRVDEFRNLVMTIGGSDA